MQVNFVLCILNGSWFIYSQQPRIFRFLMVAHISEKSLCHIVSYTFSLFNFRSEQHLVAFIQNDLAVHSSLLDLYYINTMSIMLLFKCDHPGLTIHSFFAISILFERDIKQFVHSFL